MKVYSFDKLFENKITSFIKRSIFIHNNFYNYDKVNYINSKSPVLITCPNHGDFYQIPYNHLMGKGCKKCSVERNKLKSTKSIDKFIDDSKNVHYDTFNYDKVKYVNDSTKVIITCLKHGDFEQTPNKHLLGQGCPFCKFDKSKKSFSKKYSSSFIDRSNRIHNGYYDYSKVKHINAKYPVEITCPKHGVFLQLPYNHLMGKGCIKCSQSQGEKIIESFLILNKVEYEFQKKFPDCKNKIPLSFDFYLPKFNVLIEFDGLQHYKSLGYFGGDKKLKFTQLCDKIKNEYCLKNNIRLIRIPYSDIKNIDKILSRILI